MDLNEVKTAVDGLSTTFIQFQEANDLRLKSIEEKGYAPADLEEKVTKLNTDVDAWQEKLSKVNDNVDLIATAANRSGAGSDDSATVKLATAFLHLKDSKTGREFDEKNIDVEEFLAYQKSFGKYLRKDEKGMGPDQYKALSVGSDPDGGYWVTPQMSARIITDINESSPLRELATVETISGNSLELVSDTDEAASGWVAEKESRPETATPQIKKNEIVAHEIYAEPRATQRMLDDTGFSVEGWLARKIADKFRRTEATAYVNGTGVGKPRGIMSYTAGTAWGTIEQVVSGAAAAVTFDGLIDLETALKEDYRNRAVFLMKRTTVGAVRKLKDSNGQYLWQPNLQVGQPATLMGYPVRLANDVAAVAANALAVAFGDFGAAYTIVERSGIRVLRDPYTAKPFVKFYSTRRVGGDVVNFEAFKIQKIST